MKAKEFLKDRKLDKGRLTMHLDGADYSVDLQNLLEEYKNKCVIEELELLMEQYKNKCVIDELETFIDHSGKYFGVDYAIKERIKELKQ